jgi:tricorn protease
MIKDTNVITGRYVRGIAATDTELYALAGDSIWNAHTLEPMLLNHGIVAEFCVLDKQIAFLSEIGGNFDLFVLDRSRSEQPRRLTTWAAKSPNQCMIAGYTQNTSILLSSTHESVERRVYDINLETKLITECRFGFNVQRVSVGVTHTIIQRNGYGYHGSWRGYQGGAVGQLWIAKQNQAFAPLLPKDTDQRFLRHNTIEPVQYKDRVYFLSDALGCGNVHSCDLNGQDLRQETHCTEFYVKSFAFCKDRLYYVSGGQIYSQQLANPMQSAHLPLDIPHSNNYQANLVGCHANYCHALDISADHKISLVSRGNLHQLTHTSQTLCNQHDFENAVWLDKDTILATTTDTQTRLYKIDQSNCVSNLAIPDIGIITEIIPSPEGKMACITTNRHELHLYTLENSQIQCIATNSGRQISGVHWSPDGRYVLYASGTRQTSVVRLFDTQTHAVHDITPANAHCSNPIFDNAGKYIAFVQQEIDSTSYPYDRKYTHCIRVATLALSTPSPITGLGAFAIDANKADTTTETEQNAQDRDDSEIKGKKDGKKASFDPNDLVNIFARAERRALLQNSNVILLAMTEKGIISAEVELRNDDMDDEAPTSGWSIILREWQEPKPTTLIEQISHFASKNDWMVCLTLDDKLVTTKLGEKPPTTDARTDTPGTWHLPHITINPLREWRALFTQAWRLTKEHFYNGSTESIDWDLLYTKYGALLPTISSRHELNEVIAQMHGELRTSHAYIYKDGDVTRSRRTITPGDLYARLTWNGQYWVYNESYPTDGEVSPLGRFALKPGTLVTHINNHKLDLDCTPASALLGKTNTNIHVRTCDPEDLTQVRILQTQALSHNPRIYYYAWRANNARKVPQHIGYVHIPDMMQFGFKEFWRQYIHMYNQSGLILDIRNNGGGNASSAILPILVGRRLGEHVPKFHQKSSYPQYSTHGPIVVLINGYCGSDGDMFAQAYKDMRSQDMVGGRFGPLIGTRTWGGVTGIWPRYMLHDNGLTTQAEFAIRFDSVGFGVENEGVTPDIEVINTPDREVAGFDDQLDRAIKELESMIKK